jgi:hypothetical protein
VPTSSAAVATAIINLLLFICQLHFVGKAFASAPVWLALNTNADMVGMFLALDGNYVELRARGDCPLLDRWIIRFPTVLIAPSE